MPFIKSNKAKLIELRTKIGNYKTNIDSYLNGVMGSSNYTHTIRSTDGKTGNDLLAVNEYNRRAYNYNAAAGKINTLASDAKDAFDRDIQAVYDQIDSAIKGIDNFENDEECFAAINALDKLTAEMSESTYAALYAFSSDGSAADPYSGEEAPDAKDPAEDGQSSTGGGSGSYTEDYEVEYDEGEGSEGGGSGDDDTDHEQETEPGSGGDGEGLGDDDTDHEQETEPGSGSEGGGDGDDDTDHEQETEPGSGSDGEGSGDDETDHEQDTGAGTGGDGTGDEDYTPEESDPTPADIIEVSESLIGGDPTIGGGTGAGTEGTGDVDWGLAGAAAATLLGLVGGGSGNGDDENYLQNLAMGLDGDRTLADAGIDVFEHPDYTGNGDDATNLGLQYDADGNLITGGGSEGLEGDDFDNGEVGAFGLNPSDGTGEDGDESGRTAGVAGSLGALAGAAAVGGIAAGGLMAYDESTGGMFDGGAGIGPDGKYFEGKKSLNDVFFGPPIDGDDEEEKKKQSLREKIAMIATASSTTAALGTFGLANGGVIGPTWFTIAAILFAVSLLYFNMVKDQKNKRREEINAMKQTSGSGKKSFFGVGAAAVAAEATPESKEVDWILFGMVLLSTSGFILKTYDVIDWLLFLILLILFILIIVAYIILKKKMGEDDKKGPMKK